MSQRTSVAFEIRRFDREDRSLHTYVLVGRLLRLGAEAEPANLLKKSPLAGVSIGDSTELAARLVGVLYRNGKGASVFFSNPDDPDVDISQKRFSFLGRHREGHARSSMKCQLGAAPKGSGISRARLFARRLHAVISQTNGFGSPDRMPECRTASAAGRGDVERPRRVMQLPPRDSRWPFDGVGDNFSFQPGPTPLPPYLTRHRRCQT
jgi:hypothetical protein